MSVTYSQRLRDPRWQKKRLEMMELSNWKCESCLRSDKTLNVHHCVYHKNTEPWEYESCELFVLCEDCHLEIHELRAWIDVYLSKSTSTYLTWIIADFLEGLVVTDAERALRQIGGLSDATIREVLTRIEWLRESDNRSLAERIDGRSNG